MKKKLTKEESADLLPKIQAVLQTGKPWEDETLHHPVEAIVSAILTLKGVSRRKLSDARYGIIGFDTNGWQWDWWQYFDFEGDEYVLSGSGYYGGHSFGKAEL